MKQFIRNWWHILTAVAGVVWFSTSGAVSWVQEVNASMRLTSKLEETSVRKDVLNQTMLRIETELRLLNENFERHYREESPHE